MGGSAKISQYASAIHPTTVSSSTMTQLNERRWNFNDGESPWGMKKNAEIWNGRAAQMGFVIILAQELITGKGVIAGIQEGNPINLAFLGVTVLAVAGLTGFLALQGDSVYEGMEDLDMADLDTDVLGGDVDITPSQLRQRISDMDPQLKAELEEAVKTDGNLREAYEQLKILASWQDGSDVVPAGLKKVPVENQ